jgi:hypothetical protein
LNRRASWAVTVLAAVLVAQPARAGGLEISAALAYWTENSSALSVTVGKFWDLAGVQIGPRVGFAYVTQPNSGGIPADAVLRIPLGPLYLEGQVGAWFLFARSPTVRFHATGGVGLELGILRIGAEAGYLSTGGLIGGRISLAL